MAKERKHKPNAHSADAVPFLADAPAEINLLLNWFQAGAKPEECTKELEKFASSFLGALVQDQAVIPKMNVHSPKLLAWVLMHHLRNPENCAAWLNLGLALRRVALSEKEPLAGTRIQRALECFERSLALAANERPVRIRALTGKAFAYAQLHKFEEGVQCSSEALELDRSDPSLWLLHSSILGIAGRNEEALELIDEAYKAYVMAGCPEGLRYLFDGVVPPVSTEHLRRMQ